MYIRSYNAFFTYIAMSAASVIPPMFVATLGGDAGFICHSFADNVASVQWFLNGTRLESLALRNVLTTAAGRRLLINDVSSELNTSRIWCIATITQRDMTLHTVNATNEGLLLIQGIMSPSHCFSYYVRYVKVTTNDTFSH